MTLTTPYSLRQRVWIPNLELWGTIGRIVWDSDGVRYYVEWIADGRRQDAYLYPHEISAEKCEAAR